MYPYSLLDLPYEYNALEPAIDEATMKLHHQKHHQAYIDKLNAALESHPELQQKTLEELLGSLETLPEDVRTPVRHHGGGHANHSLFWTILKPQGGGEPSGKIANAIDSTFGSFSNFSQEFTKAASGIFGSGWAYLATEGNPSTSSGEAKLHLHALPLQDTPLMHGHKPLLGLDVWEHAYYLKYQNKRPDYISAWWSVVNWEEVEKRFNEA